MYNHKTNPKYIVKPKRKFPDIGKVLVTLILLAAFSAVIWTIRFALQKDERMRSYLGSEVVIADDTLTVVDYSYNNQTFTMNNRLKVDESLVFNNTLENE